MDEIEVRDNELLHVEGESSHRLEPVVLSAYKEKIDDGIENPFHDENSLFMFFTDATLARRAHDIAYHESYKIVIRDVLEHMERNGILCRDEGGCYYLAPEALRVFTQS